LMDHQGNAGRVHGGDHGLGIFQRRRERLLADRRHLVACGKLDQRAVAADRRGDIDEIEAAVGEHVVRRPVAPRHAELVADDAEPLRITVADRHDLDVGEVLPAMHLVDGEEAAADQRTLRLRHAQPAFAICIRVTRCWRRRWAWSTTTATMITRPLITICQNELTPIITNPSERMPITKAPMIVPPMVPRPPDMDVPPRTAAAMAFSSRFVPVAGCEAISSEEMTRPTMAAQKPENM